jgi:MYXO-CTERM domain-containing protein
MATRFRFVTACVLGAAATLSDRAEAIPGLLATKGGAPASSATAIVALRDESTTVLSFQASVEGTLDDFALVIPVPETVDLDDVQSAPSDAFAALDRFTAPRLEELWEQDPCKPLFDPPKPEPGVEPRPPLPKETRLKPSVAPYEDARIVEGKDAASAAGWLKEHGYAVSASGAQVLERAARDRTRLLIVTGRASRLVKTPGGASVLPPLRVTVEGMTPALPSRLVAGDGPNEAVVWLVGAEQRLELAGESVAAPSDLGVTEAAAGSLGGLWAATLEKTLTSKNDKLVLVYSDGAESCAPCAGPPLTAEQWDALGADRLPSLTKTTEMPRVRPVDPAGLHKASVHHVEAALLPCFQAALEKTPKLEGTVVVTTSTSTKEWTVKVDLDGAEKLGPVFAKCAAELEAKGLRVTSPHGAMKDIRFSLAVEPIRAPLALTVSRYHLRDGPGGARDLSIQPGKGADLQTRYVIRHPWTEPITCASPKRGVWGAAPRSVKGRPLQALTGLPFDRAAPAPLEPLLAEDAPSLGVTKKETAPPPPQASAPSSDQAPSAGGCGCAVGARPPRGVEALLLAALALLRTFSFRPVRPRA